MSIRLPIRPLLVLCVLLAAGDAMCAQSGGGGGGGARGVGGGQVGPGASNNDNNNTVDEPSSVVGAAFNILLGDATAKTRQKSRITFTTAKITSDALASLGADGMAFTEKKGKHAESPVTFTGKGKGSKGSIVEITGTATGDGIFGTITVTAKDGKKQDVPFSGGKPGSDEEKKVMAK